MSPSRNPIDRRRRELEAEEARIRRRVKALMREAGGGEAALDEAPPRGPEGEGEGPVLQSPEDTARLGRNPNLAHYLSSGSFGKSSVPMSHERRVQRNKVIFLVILGALAVFILIRMLG